MNKREILGCALMAPFAIFVVGLIVLCVYLMFIEHLSSLLIGGLFVIMAYMFMKGFSLIDRGDEK